jgi:hypothetical protein
MRLCPSPPPAGLALRLFALVALTATTGCSEPGFLRQAEPAPTPSLLPIEEILTGESVQLDAEAAAALSARGAALRARVVTAP